jgi:hypothetical protein
VEPATCLVELVKGQFANFVGVAHNCTIHISLSFLTEFPLATTARGNDEYVGGMFLRDVAVRPGE